MTEYVYRDFLAPAPSAYHRNKKAKKNCTFSKKVFKLDLNYNPFQSIKGQYSLFHLLRHLLLYVSEQICQPKTLEPLRCFPFFGSKHLKPYFTIDSPFNRHHQETHRYSSINDVIPWHCVELMVKWAESRPYPIEGVLLQTPYKHYANSLALLPQKRTDAHRVSDGASVFLVFRA